jgi:Mg2+ and Co2+ transporter CorA
MATLTRYRTSGMEKIRSIYAKQLQDIEKEDEFKISPYYVLYELIDEMYDKVLQGLKYFAKDLRELDGAVFDT